MFIYNCGWDFVKKNLSFSQIFFDERNKTKKTKLSDLAKRWAEHRFCQSAICKITFLYNFVVIGQFLTKSKVLFISFIFWLFGVESRNFSHAEKERTPCKAEQIHKMTIILTQKGSRLLFWVKRVVILWICSALQVFLSLSAWKKSRDSTCNIQKLED